jgi:hypothetical protein
MYLVSVSLNVWHQVARKVPPGIFQLKDEMYKEVNVDWPMYKYVPLFDSSFLLLLSFSLSFSFSFV